MGPHSVCRHRSRSKLEALQYTGASCFSGGVGGRVLVDLFLILPSTDSSLDLYVYCFSQAPRPVLDTPRINIADIP